MKNIHFIGIGGIGMSALARWFMAHQYNVSGSDSSSSSLLNELKVEGATIHIGHFAKNINSSVDLVVHTSAVGVDNPEFIKAKELGIEVRSYASVVGEVIKKYKPLCVAGAHGKSTTSSLLALIFVKAGLNPTVIVGTKLKEFKGSNFRKGNGKYFILESDEHTRAFLNYSPFGALITNIDREHLDCYKNLTDIKKTFLKFINNIKRGGVLVVNSDNKNLFSLKNKISEIAKKNKIKVIWCGLQDKKTLDIVNKIRKVIKILGEHNVLNALEAYLLARNFGISEKNILFVISRFYGAWRRMECRGKLQIANSKWLQNVSVPVYDDYAHHPTEIKVTLVAFKEKYPAKKLICVFQPHQAKRLEVLFKEFTRAFDAADFLVLLDIYKVAGRETKINVPISKLASEVKDGKKAPKVVFLKDEKRLKNELIKIVSKNPDSVIVMMGAGNIYTLTNSLIK